MILWTTILNKLEIITEYKDIRFIDIRYLDKWIKDYPKCFPKYMIKNNHNIKFNHHKLRYEIRRNK